MNYNAVLSQNQPVKDSHHFHMRYKDKDPDQTLRFPAPNLQQCLEHLKWGPCILEVVEPEGRDYNELENVLGINKKKANPSISASHAICWHSSGP